jgi:sugar lactone lactonase YvrE
MSELRPHAILAAQNTLGEGVLWDGRRRALWWTDIHGHRLHRQNWEQDQMTCYTTPQRLCSFGLVAGREKLVSAFASGIALYDPASPQWEWLARPELAPGVRFNDGRVDRRGRFWSGTMVEGVRPRPNGGLYTVGSTGGARCQLRGVTISNGLCFSPDGRHMYFADSPTRIIQVFDVIEPQGLLSAPRLFAQTPPGAYPDGAAVDADGCLWSAHWGAGRIVRYTPSGRVDRTVEIPTAQPSCVCFGGPGLDVLCVTTARHGLDAGQLAAEPNAGDVFLYRTGVRGLPESEFVHD